jgi:hypothetical protein
MIKTQYFKKRSKSMSLEKNKDLKNIDKEFQEKLVIFKKYKYLKR